MLCVRAASCIYGILVTLFWILDLAQCPRVCQVTLAVSNVLADSYLSEKAYVASLEPECVPALFESKLPCAWTGSAQARRDRRSTRAQTVGRDKWELKQKSFA